MFDLRIFNTSDEEITEIALSDIEYPYSLEEEFTLIGTLLVKCVIDLDYKEEAIGLSINELEELLTCIKRLNHSGYQSYLCFIDKIDHQEAVVRIFVRVRKNSTNKIYK